MKVITHYWSGLSRPDAFTLYPIADIHLGNIACDEKRLQVTVDTIAADPTAYWVGLGDYCDFINRTDKRFDPETVAPWLRVKADLAGAQRDRLVEMLRPIAARCLGLVCGNHEYSILARYERDIYSEIVTGVKEAGGLGDKPLALGTVGWLMLEYSRVATPKTGARSTVVLSVQHGHTGGKLAGAKALDMQRWLWTHECDLALAGHSHVTQMQAEAVETVSRGAIVRKERRGVICGTFLTLRPEVDIYADRAGHLPLGHRTVVVQLRPGAERNEDRVRVTF